MARVEMTAFSVETGTIGCAAQEGLISSWLVQVMTSSSGTEEMTPFMVNQATMTSGGGDKPISATGVREPTPLTALARPNSIFHDERVSSFKFFIT
jgi:hypothetical protein